MGRPQLSADGVSLSTGTRWLAGNVLHTPLCMLLAGLWAHKIQSIKHMGHQNLTQLYLKPANLFSSLRGCRINSHGKSVAFHILALNTLVMAYSNYLQNVPMSCHMITVMTTMLLLHSETGVQSNVIVHSFMYTAIRCI